MEVSHQDLINKLHILIEKLGRTPIIFYLQSWVFPPYYLLSYYYTLCGNLKHYYPNCEKIC